MTAPRPSPPRLRGGGERASAVRLCVGTARYTSSRIFISHHVTLGPPLFGKGPALYSGDEPSCEAEHPVSGFTSRLITTQRGSSRYSHHLPQRPARAAREAWHPTARAESYHVGFQKEQHRELSHGSFLHQNAAACKGHLEARKEPVGLGSLFSLMTPTVLQRTPPMPRRPFPARRAPDRFFRGL